MANKEKKQVKNSKDKTSFFKSFKAELKKLFGQHQNNYSIVLLLY